MKKVFFGSVAATGAILLSGCCGYQGYAEYDAPTELSRENERVTAEREGIRLEGGAVRVEKLVDYSYDQNLQIDTKKASLYTEGSGIQVVGNFICYPLTLISSPVRLLVMEDKIKKELGHEYKYTYGRQVWNMFNPLICVLGDYKEEAEIVSSRKAKEKRTRTEHIQIKDGKIQFACGNRKKELNATATVQELYQSAFEYPLPLKEEKVTLTYNGKSYDFTLKSSDMLTAGDLAAWDKILKCQDSALLKDGSIMASLETLHKAKKIGDADCKKEADRLNGLIDAKKFPAKAISDNRIKFTDEFVSGTAYSWAESVFEKANPGMNHRDKCYSRNHFRDWDDQYVGFMYQFNNNTLFFADIGNNEAVLVQKESIMPKGISSEQVVQKIMKEHPDGKLQNFQYKDSKSFPYDENCKHIVDTTVYCAVIKTKTTVWKVCYNISVSRYETDAFTRRMLKVKDGEKTIGATVVTVGDRNLVEYFVKQYKAKVEEAKQKIKREEEEAKKKAMNQF